MKNGELTYKNWLADLKSKISEAQQRTFLHVNTEMLQLYWYIGNQIIEKQKLHGWGSKIAKQLSIDLQSMFPDVKGFSKRNLAYMRKFAETYPDFPIVQAPLAQIAETNTNQLVEFTQVPLAQITWYHHITLLEKVKDHTQRLFYIAKTIENNWSQPVMVMQIESKLHERQGKAITNFKNTLPVSNSDLAQAVLKDPYKFDFLCLKERADERSIEIQLTGHITRFLLELGKGFAFIGQQYELIVDSKEFYIDLLFYHLKLRCYLVIELKKGEFTPQDLGQLSFYISSVDNQLRNQYDMPTIGLLLCKEKNRLVAEYALQGYTQPIGISNFELSKAIPNEILPELPSIEDIENELSEDE